MGINMLKRLESSVNSFRLTISRIQQLAPLILEKTGLHSAMVSGTIEAKSTVKLKQKMDFNTVLTLFSPVSKEKDVLFPGLKDEVDVLIATDCISEGQNLQDCDYLINYDIHWNPVRIIQRFGRIDRIGSKNEVIQLVNYWPDMELDDYIDLKGRVESRMKISVLTSTGDDNPLSVEEKGDLEYRRQQLKRLQEEVVDLKKSLPKKAIYEKFGLKSAQRDAFDADISRIDIVNVVSSSTVLGLKAGERVKEFYVLLVTLKRQHYDEKNILLLTKLIKQNMVFALAYNDMVRFAVVHEKLFVMDWELLEDAALPLMGLDLDKVWENLVTTIGGFEVMEGVTMEEQIAIDGEKLKKIKAIESLEKKLRVEKQPRKKFEMYQELMELKKFFSNS